ncbi:hypothetical protein ACLKA7_004687 [Drosophila subpalustris]
MQLLRLSRQLFHFVLCLFGVRWNRLQLLALGLWFIWYVLIWMRTATGAAIFEECALECLLTHSLFLLLTSGHCIILLDTFWQRRHHRTLWAQERNHFDHFDHFDHLDGSVALSLGLVLIPSIVLISVVCLCRFWLDLQLPGRSLFWITMPSYVGLQLRLFGFLADILLANVRVVSARKRLKLLANSTARQLPEIESVVQLKLRCGQLNNLFAVVNLCYGNSLLIIFIVLFLSLVFNFYWLVRNLLLQPNSLAEIVVHLSFISNLGLVLSVICWHCQQSFNHSRQIGCLISKLVKPLACKRYNDLICEFLLQTLHQRFVLTAKDFFSLNLHLLSSMCAAVVTYLVILIQFMFAEKGSQVQTLNSAKSPEQKA